MRQNNVTPFAGVWVEIYAMYCAYNYKGKVTPFAGVWVEIVELPLNLSVAIRHTLRGCVG